MPPARGEPPSTTVTDTDLQNGRALLGLPDDANGVLPSQALHRAIGLGFVDAGEFKVPAASVQPASIDLHLGDVAYRIRCSFLPDRRAVRTKLEDFIVDELDISRNGAVLETNRPYLIPLRERLALPPDVRGKANPKSSTGRLDVFTRVITDHGARFDEIEPGYRGPMYLEVVPLSYTVRVKEGLALNQLRLSVGQARLQDADIHEVHEREPLLLRAG